MLPFNMLLRNKLFSTRVVLSLEVCSKNYNSRILGKLNLFISQPLPKSRSQINKSVFFIIFKPSLGGPVSEVAGLCDVVEWHRDLSLSSQRSWQRVSRLDSENAEGISPIRAISVCSPHTIKQLHPAAAATFRNCISETK